MTHWHKYLRRDFCNETTDTTMNMLKVTLNGDDAARFLKIRERLNYDSNAKIVKTLIVQFIRHYRKAKTEKPYEDHKSLYGGAMNPREEGLRVEQARYVTTGRRLKLIKNPENRVKRDPLQIKVRLTDRETKTLDEIIENSGGKVRSHYQIAKTLIRELLKYQDGGMVEADKIEVYKIRKKWRKSEKSAK